MSIKFTSHKDDFLKAEDEAVQRAMELIGLRASRFVKEGLTSMYAVDTGRLRGSYTYATKTARGSGESPATGKDYATRSAPKENQVCIGSNVEYAPTIEAGSHRMAARPALRNAIENHMPEYKSIIESELKK